MKNRPEGVLKVGDIVQLKPVDAKINWPTGIIVDRDICGWLWVSQSDGVLKMWPESQMEMVADSHMLMPDDLKGNEL